MSENYSTEQFYCDIPLSPTDHQISKIEHKLAQLSNNKHDTILVGSTKVHKIRQSDLSSKIKEHIEKVEDYVSQLKIQMKSADYQLDLIQKNSKISFQNRTLQIISLRERIDKFLLIEQTERKEITEALMVNFAKNMEDITTIYAKNLEMAQREESVLNSRLAQEMPPIQNYIDRENQNELKQLKIIEATFEKESEQLKSQLMDITVKSEQSTKSLMLELQNTIARIKEDIQNEKNERERGKLKITELLDRTVKKMDQ